MCVVQCIAAENETSEFVVLNDAEISLEIYQSPPTEKNMCLIGGPKILGSTKISLQYADAKKIGLKI